MFNSLSRTSQKGILINAAGLFIPMIEWMLTNLYDYYTFCFHWLYTTAWMGRKLKTNLGCPRFWDRLLNYVRLSWWGHSLMHTLLIQKSHFNSFKAVVLLTHFDYPWSHFKMTLERVRMQINPSEVSFYTDLKSFRLLFGIEVSFWPNVGVKTTSKVETTD